MSDLFRDAPIGQIIRLVSGKRYLKYPEEKDPEIWTKYISAQKSANLAHHGETEKQEDGPEPEKMNGFDSTNARHLTKPSNERHSSDASSQTRVGDVNAASGVKVDPEHGKDIHLVTWYGDDDPENPQNWSQPKKYFVTFQICLLTLSVYIGSAIYTAGVVDVMAIFGVSQVVAILGLCLFVAGYGLGPMLWAPMSEIPYIGRNPVYIGTLAVFVVLQIPTALATNFGMLLAFRFLTGFFGSPILATGGASLADIYSPRKRAYAMSIYGIAAVCGPTLGPLVSGFAVLYAPLGGGFTSHWTWPIWELCFLSAFCFVFLFFCFPETSANNLLVRRAKRLRALTGNDKLKSEPELMAESMTAGQIVSISLIRPFTLNFTEPMVLLLNLYIALIYGLLYIWFESFPIVFVEIYGFTEGTLGLAFMGILLGSLITIPPFFTYLYYKLEPQFDENGDITPEKRLVPCCVGAFCIPICLFWFGWSSRADIHWIVPIIGSAWFSIGAVLLFNSILNYLPDAYPEYAASVLAGNDLMRSSFGAGFPLFATAMYKNLGVNWASSTLAFISIAFIPIPFILVKYGGTLRKNYSKHARKDI